MDEIIDYIVETPQNTNPNILRSMLNNLSPGSGWLTVDVYEENDPATGTRYITNFDTAEPIVRALPYVCFVFHWFDPETGEPWDLEYRIPTSLNYTNDEKFIEIRIPADSSSSGYLFQAQNIHSPLVGRFFT